MSTNRTAHSISEYSSETGWVPIEQLIRFQISLLKTGLVPCERTPNAPFKRRQVRTFVYCHPQLVLRFKVFTMWTLQPIPIFTRQRGIHRRIRIRTFAGCEYGAASYSQESHFHTFTQISRLHTSAMSSDL